MSGRVDIPPERWRRWQDKIILACGECGQEASLDHDIDKDGNVSPVRLVGWQP